MSRKLVTLRKIDEVLPIEKADRLELLKLGGWQCVTGKGNFQPGDYAVYFEVDCFLPSLTDDRFEFLKKDAIKWNGLEGTRMKTIRLRGELSQGLCLPVTDFPEISQAVYSAQEDPEFGGTIEDLDFSDLLGVVKWERILPSNLQGVARGNFPSFLRKTDQERIQNIWNKVKSRDDTYEVSLKLDGSSMTVYLSQEGEFGVCSRNLDLVETEGNAFWNAARALNLEDQFRKLELYGLALQGELIGPGIQDNPEGLTEPQFRVFDIWSCAQRSYVSADIRNELIGLFEGLLHVPIINPAMKMDFEDINDLLAFASGPSLNAKDREGLVFKSLDDPSFTWKVISNEYLMKHPDR